MRCGTTTWSVRRAPRRRGLDWATSPNCTPSDASPRPQPPTTPAAAAAAGTRTDIEADGRGPRADPAAARRDSARPAAASSDFEIQADHSGQSPQSDARSRPRRPRTRPGLAASSAARPDDVTFPVIPDRPDDRSPADATRPAGREPEREPPPRHGPGRMTDDEDEEDDANDADIPDFDEQIEILDDDDACRAGDPRRGWPERSRALRRGRRPAATVPATCPCRSSPRAIGTRTGRRSRAAKRSDFTLSRSGPMTVEELDLAPMVDVAFQLVLFFMVTATTVLYKTLEIPKPTTDQAPARSPRGIRARVEDLQKDYILVEIDAGGAIKIDREPVAGDAWMRWRSGCGRRARRRAGR